MRKRHRRLPTGHTRLVAKVHFSRTKAVQATHHPDVVRCGLRQYVPVAIRNCACTKAGWRRSSPSVSVLHAACARSRSPEFRQSSSTAVGRLEPPLGAEIPRVLAWRDLSTGDIIPGPELMIIEPTSNKWSVMVSQLPDAAVGVDISVVSYG